MKCGGSAAGGHYSQTVYTQTATGLKITVIPEAGPRSVVETNDAAGELYSYTTTAAGVLKSLTRTVLDLAGRAVLSDRYIDLNNITLPAGATAAGFLGTGS